MKRVLALIAIVVIVVIAWLAFSGKSNDNSSSKNQAPPNTKATQHRAQSISSDKVTIDNFAFSPANITVKTGTTVTWTNQDSTAHTVTENDGKDGPSAPPISSGQSYSFTFHKAGTFHYHCSIHPQMTGTVTVTE